MANLEEKLLKEIRRFNQIGYNSINLEEQMLGLGGGSGFKNNQGDSDRLKKFQSRQVEMSEQEDPEAAAEDDDVTSFAEMGVVDDAGEVDIEAEMGTPADDAAAPPPPPAAPADAAAPVDDAAVPADTADTTDTAVPVEEPEADEDTTEVEVTDLIDKQDTLEKSSEQANTKLDSLMSMLDGMEDKLSGMDQLMSQINSLEQKIEEFRPKTEEEKLDNRKLDSGPFDQSLSDFWDDSQDKFQTQGKEEYILKPDDVENFSDTEIQKSFNI
jgi:hypothetical protein|tara:strand:- start:186 stop:995 length:810 start_codon:yes stop_codon:yes gene_type:complete